MIRIANRKSNDGVKIDLLRREESYSLCLLGEKVFGLLRLKVPKLTKKTLLFMLLILCGGIESCPGPQAQNNLQELSSLRGIKLIHQNIRGLFGKRDALQTLFTNEKFVLTLSETHISSTNSDLFKMPGFQFIHKDRNNREGGGVAMYLSDDLKWKRRTDLEKEEIECIWVEIDIYKGKNFLVGCIYRPPDSSNYLSKDFNKHLNEMLTKVNDVSMETFLLGDINVNYLTKSSHKEIKHIFITHGFDQLIKVPTRITRETKTLIDVIMTNDGSSVQQTKVIPLSLSDHDCVTCVRKINHRKTPFRTITCRDYSKYNHTELARDVENHDWNPVYTAKNVNTAWDYLKQVLTSIVDRHAPLITKRIKGRQCPWMSHEIKTIMDTRDKILRKARKTNKECDWSNYKRLKNKCNNKVKQGKQKYHKDLLTENSRNPAKFWQCIKEIFPTKEPTPFSATTSTDRKKNTETANSLCSFFTNVAQTLKTKVFKLRDFIWEKPPTPGVPTKLFSFSYVSRIFVERELKSLKRRKAAGCDNFPPGILKDAAYAFSYPLTHLINLSLSTGQVPTEWKVAKITPIHKGGSTGDNNNFSPISVLTACSKILERAFHKQLISHLENNELLSKNQFGYRKHRSTELSTTLLADNIRKAVDEGNIVGVLYVDLSKAFDTLSHSVLLEKLKSFGISGTTHDWFSDYLFNRKQFCVVEKCESEVMNITCGVPQGSILGPLLFLIYLNDFENCLKNSKMLNFADDTAIYVHGKSKDRVENQLNEDLIFMSSYFQINQLVINLKKGKTETMIFGTAKILSKFNKKLTLYYNGDEIHTTETYKYLGTILDSNLSLSTNFDKMYKKTTSKLRMLYSLRKYLDQYAKVKIYRGMILPCITYNCTINLNLTQTQKQKLQTIDRLVAKVTGVKQPLVENEVKKHSVLLVRKCIEKLTCENFNDFFKIQSHGRVKRNNGYSLQIPITKLKYAKSGFFSMGATLYNNLPNDVRKVENFSIFKKTRY